jgi:spermidine/putrescine-binding protein
MAKAKSDAVWQEIDPASLPEAQSKLYAEYKAQHKVMQATKAAFEDSFAPAAPKGKRFVFGYNFGKLSMAIVEDDRKPAPKAQRTLADWLKQEAGR